MMLLDFHIKNDSKTASLNNIARKALAMIVEENLASLLEFHGKLTPAKGEFCVKHVHGQLESDYINYNNKT